jgi:hypothetical protein
MVLFCGLPDERSLKEDDSGDETGEDLLGTFGTFCHTNKLIEKILQIFTFISVPLMGLEAVKPLRLQPNSIILKVKCL